jgi:hypothetical protein
LAVLLAAPRSAAGAGHPRACRLSLPASAEAFADIMDAAGAGADAVGPGLECTRLVQAGSAAGRHAAAWSDRAAGELQSRRVV